MQISVSDAKARLTELLRRAEAGEDIVLTRHGRPVARLAPIVGARNRKARLADLDACATQTGPGRRLAQAARHPGISFSARITRPNDRARDK